MIDDQGPESDEGEGEGEELGADVQSQIFLEMRGQNLELLRIAAQVAGYGGNHGPLKPGDLKNALKGVWDIYSEFYTWVDPEESSEDEEDDEA